MFQVITYNYHTSTHGARQVCYFVSYMYIRSVNDLGSYKLDVLEISRDQDISLYRTVFMSRLAIAQPPFFHALVLAPATNELGGKKRSTPYLVGR